jgi:hypothetical protein
MFHPAAALRSTDVERQSYDDIAALPRVLLDARRRRVQPAAGQQPVAAQPVPAQPAAAATLAQQLPTVEPLDDSPTLF